MLNERDQALLRQMDHLLVDAGLLSVERDAVADRASAALLEQFDRLRDLVATLRTLRREVESGAMAEMVLVAEHFSIEVETLMQQIKWSRAGEGL